MKRTVLMFGLISGGILAAVTAVTIPLCMNRTFPEGKAELLGYTTMVLAFLAVFFGIRSYRQNELGGAITFGKAFKVGILITLVTCAVYVIGWEIAYYGFFPDFGDKYAARTIEMLKESGASQAKIAAETAKMARFKELYRNPAFNVGMTFLEIFPVGLIVTLVSAAILRRRPEGASPAELAGAASGSAS